MSAEPLPTFIHCSSCGNVLIPDTRIVPLAPSAGMWAPRAIFGVGSVEFPDGVFCLTCGPPGIPHYLADKLEPAEAPTPPCPVCGHPAPSHRPDGCIVLVRPFARDDRTAPPSPCGCNAAIPHVAPVK